MLGFLSRFVGWGTRRQAMHSHMRKPTLLIPPAIESCTPIPISQLCPWVIHKGRVLRGKLITEAIKAKSVQSVLEDEAGDVVTVHMYNVPGLSGTNATLSDLKAAQALFPPGQGLAIMEPFYKIMMDGTPGVRVDNPAEVLFLDAGGQPVCSAAEVARRHSGKSPGTASGSIAGQGSISTPADVPGAKGQGSTGSSKPQRPNKSNNSSNKQGKRRRC